MSELIVSVLAEPTLERVQALEVLACSGPSFEERKAMESNGLVACLAQLLGRRATDPSIPKAVFTLCWRYLRDFVVIYDLDNANEYGPQSTSQVCLELGVLEHCRDELVQNYSDCEDVLYFIGWVVQNPATIPRLVDLGCHVEMIQHVVARDGMLEPSMAALRALTILEGPVRQRLREDGALDAAVPFLSELTSVHEGEDEAKLRQGFRATSIVSRLAGNDEAGIGPEVLRGNPLAVATLVLFLQRAIANGQQSRTYFSMGTIPSLITTDILVIAASDVNKPLLVKAIPVMFKAVKECSQNTKLMQHIVKILLLLSFDKLCLAELRSVAAGGKERLAMLDKAILASDPEHRRCFENLNSIVCSPLAGKATFRNLIHSVLKRAPSSPSVANGNQHVMLSYNWRSKPLVLHINSLLNAQGIKTWIDEFNMGPNVTDAMASAVENASFVVVFVTKKYKESGNCRRECEYADTFEVPIVYVLAEENFKPSGWLALQMGKSLYLTIATVEQADQRTGQIISRVRGGTTPKSNGAGSPPSMLNLLSEDSTPTTNAVMWQQMMAKMDQMSQELVAVREESRAMRNEIAELKSLLK
ncbi:hypothetical protein BASA81_011046 [Batrachochytrium salamandrivorans]|nr:hypothetical protein BASA81_011046 [Batrachochytrium salamandrivorans]